MWQGKRVVILGAARQGMALARWLAVQGARVTLSDTSAQIDDRPLADIRHRITFVLGGHPLTLLDGCDVLCLSGGVPIDLPIVLEARRRHIPLSNDAQVFFDVCSAPIIGITGSAGKTTTTTLVGEILRQASVQAGAQTSGHADERAFRRVFVGGNIGNPLISDVDQIGTSDFVVMELSSFQLELMTTSPHIACITNITPNHLDRHGTMAAYIAAKRHIIDFQRAEDWRVMSADDPVTEGLWATPAGAPPGAQTLLFSTKRALLSGPGARISMGGSWLDSDDNLRIVIQGHIDDVICHRGELHLMGEHNIANVLAACAVCALAGAPLQAMRAVATTFRGVAHRLQLTCDVGGVRWYDDSIATAPERLMAALRCFEQPVILLCGGRDKHLPWDEAAALMLERCKHIVLFGEMAPLVRDALSRVAQATGPATGRPPTVDVRVTLQDAVEAARHIAASGDVVLLSPGGTSYDAFKDFAQRGDTFREWVLQPAPAPVGKRAAAITTTA